MLLTLELTGDDTQYATRAFKLPRGLTFSKCTLHSVDMSLRGDPLVHSWTDAQTGAYPDGISRTVYAPIYLSISGLYDASHVQSLIDSGSSPTELIPLGTAQGSNGVLSDPRILDMPLYNGTSVALPAETEITMQLFYRSVETGVFGDISSFPTESFEDYCRCTVTLVFE